MFKCIKFEATQLFSDLIRYL